MGGLREDVPGLGEFFAQTELLTQIDRPGQVLKNLRQVQRLGAVGGHLALLPAVRRPRAAGRARKDVAASWQA